MSGIVSQEVNVVSFYFSRGKYVRCFPKRIELEGRQLDFIESGIRCLVTTAHGLKHIFNMTDGRMDYRLSFEPENRVWTLLSSRGCHE